MSAYDHPLPAPELDIPSLSIDANNPQGSFTIKNTGGGQLTGYIISRQRGLVFTPSHFEGNVQSIAYNLSGDIFKNTNRKIETLAYICTNGGEIMLSISINPSPMTIPTEEGFQIANIGDFYSYAQAHPQTVRRLFTSGEFYMLLLSTGYPYMEVYENLHKDVNRERAMDNFFILSGLKGKTNLALETQSLNIIVKPSAAAHAFFYVKKSDNGYADAPITVMDGAPWLKLSNTRLAPSDFEDNRAKVGLNIDPALMGRSFVRERILIGSEAASILTLTVTKAAPLNLRLNREGYRYEDRGSIEIENNTGANIKVEVYCRDRYIRFYANTHMASAVHSIPFEIRPSAFVSTRRLFSRLPYISTYIDLRARCPGQEFKRRLYLTIGEW